MRTLVLGIPLPNVSFDNHSFLSAPSLSEYQHIIVDMSSIALATEEIVRQTGVHTTYGGQAVVNGDASAYAFGLAELLEMRGREAERLLSQGGFIVAFGHPEVTIRGVEGLDEGWPTYSWLPAAEGFSFGADLLAGFGTEGAVLTDAEHAFAGYVEQLGPMVAYRVSLNETASTAEYVRVFTRSSGGVSIGFEIAVGGGHIVVLPALAKPQSERQAVAATLSVCLARWSERGLPAIETIAADLG